MQGVTPDRVSGDAWELADAAPLGKLGLADAGGAAFKGLSVGEGGGPLGIVDDLGAVGAGMEVSGDEPWRLVGFGGQGSNQGVDPLPLPVPLGPSKLMVTNTTQPGLGAETGRSGR